MIFEKYRRAVLPIAALAFCAGIILSRVLGFLAGSGVRIDVRAGGDLRSLIYALGQLERAQEFFIQGFIFFSVERNDCVEAFLSHNRVDGSTQVAKSHLVRSAAVSAKLTAGDESKLCGSLF